MRFFLLTICVLSSCSGYRFRNQRNPLIDDGIRSVSIPMFVNKSSIPNVSPLFTSAISNSLASNTNIKIYMGDHREADAVLIGIISTPKRVNEIYDNDGSVFSDSDSAFKKSVGDTLK